MGIRGNMWIKDSQGSLIQGGSLINNRKGSIEVISMSHKVNIPADMKTGKLTGNRSHSPILITKK